jgi:Trp operon repressor
MTQNMLLKAELLVKDLPLREAAKELGVSVATLYRWFPQVKVIKPSAARIRYSTTATVP